MTTKEMYTKAKTFITDCYTELGKSPLEIEQRMKQIEVSIRERGSYEHTYMELEYGAKMAWRNSNRCIGRLFWETLQVFDQRELANEESIAAALLDHISYATNGGKIRSTITVFRPELLASDSEHQVRIWNHQLLRYAGYEKENGTVIGDPASVAFTKQCIELGWEADPGEYNILPLVIQIGDRRPALFDIPAEIVKEVTIEHQAYDRINELQLRWYAVPIVSDMRLEIGGINYPAAPFNGWYMGTEIGARNLADSERYNKLPQIAKAMDLDTSHASTLWKDKALVELNAAVLQSFKQAGVTIVDHHTAAAQFKQFERKEAISNRDVTGRWSWLIPPISPASTHIFHSSYNDVDNSPNYYYQNCPYV